MQMFEKNTQKELKAQYKILLADVWKDNRMIDYCSKSADVVIKTEKGFFLAIDKKSIKKNFCFGYSLSRDNTESFDSANNMVRFSRESKEYFLNENVKDLKNKIAFYSDKSNDLWFQNHYISQKNDLLKKVVSFRFFELPKNIDDVKEYQKVSDNDRALIVEAYKKELELFTKRLETYLKKYGLSKINSWSYWQDV